MHFPVACLQSVQRIHQELLVGFSEIVSSPTRDDFTIKEAQGPKRLVIDSEFCRFMDFFADLFVRVDIPNNAFQSLLIDGATA